MRRPAGLLVAALVGALTVPRALMRYEPAFKRYDVPIPAGPFAIVSAVVCAATFRRYGASVIRGVGVAGLAGVVVCAACSRPASRRRRKSDIPDDARLGVPANGHAQAWLRVGWMAASRDWHGGRGAHPWRSISSPSATSRHCLISTNRRRARAEQRLLVADRAEIGLGVAGGVGGIGMLRVGLCRRWSSGRPLGGSVAGGRGEFGCPLWGGGAHVRGPMAFEVALIMPFAFVTVTSATTYLPTSPVPVVQVDVFVLTGFV